MGDGTDLRPVLPAPRRDAPWLPVMAAIDECVGCVHPHDRLNMTVDECADFIEQRVRCVGLNRRFVQLPLVRHWRRSEPWGRREA
jgi:hypothetical protein